MDILIRTLAVLTLLWGGWIYLKSSDADTELRRIRNELKLAKQELVNTQATYKAEDKKRETLAGEVDALKEASQELRKAITAKKEEKRQRSAQERQERLAAERKAREEEREARIKEQEKRRETEMALLEQEKQSEKEERERVEAREAEWDAEYNKRTREVQISRLQSQIDGCIRAMDRYSSCSASAPPDKNDFGKVEKLRINWSSQVQDGIEAVNGDDKKRFEQAARKLLNTAKAIDYICNGGYVRDAMGFASDGRKILKLKERLKQLEKEKTKP